MAGFLFRSSRESLSSKATRRRNLQTQTINHDRGPLDYNDCCQTETECKRKRVELDLHRTLDVASYGRNCVTDDTKSRHRSQGPFKT